MAYIAIKGGEEAIEGAARVMEMLRLQGIDQETPLNHGIISHQLWGLHNRVLSEGGLYDPELVSLAIKQSCGDTLEAAYYLRAYRSTKPRVASPNCIDTTKMRLIRRISSAFKEIPGGQILGPTPDYSQRLFRFDLLDENSVEAAKAYRDLFTYKNLDDYPESFPKIVDILRRDGMLKEITTPEKPAFDITREPIVFPLERSAQLSIMARSETGSILAIAYSNMRGYGDVHPTIAELRVGYVPVSYPHPETGESVEAGEILMTECEIVASHQVDPDTGHPYFTLGYGACLGHNEAKAISMAILDRSLQNGRENGVNHPSENPEFVLMHIDGIDSMGFATHYKMPHYVTFESDMDRLKKSQEKMQEAMV